MQLYPLLVALLIYCGAVNAFSPQNGSTKSLHTSSSTNRMMSAKNNNNEIRDPIPNENIFFIEIGFGNDSHGQSATKAAVRACRNAKCTSRDKLYHRCISALCNVRLMPALI
jgi:hypothetical protein